MYTHPDILDAQVIGIPDAKSGEELMVWLRLREGADLIAAGSPREFCKGRLAHYKIPRYVHCVDQFPMTVSGKIRKIECAIRLSRSSGCRPEHAHTRTTLTKPGFAGGGDRAIAHGGGDQAASEGVPVHRGHGRPLGR